MLDRIKFRLIIFINIFLASFLFPGKVFAGPTHDLTDTSEFNIRFDGEGVNSYVGYKDVQFADIDNNGIDDLIITATNHGYIVFDSILSSKMANLTNFCS